MRQKFSYVLCAIFMIFGTHQMMHAAEVIGEAAADGAEAAGRLEGEVGDIFGAGESAAQRDAAHTLAASEGAEVGAIERTALEAGASQAAARAAGRAAEGVILDHITTLIRSDERVLSTLARTGVTPEIRAAAETAAHDASALASSVGEGGGRAGAITETAARPPLAKTPPDPVSIQRVGPSATPTPKGVRAPSTGGGGPVDAMKTGRTAANIGLNPAVAPRSAFQKIGGGISRVGDGIASVFKGSGLKKGSQILLGTPKTISTEVEDVAVKGAKPFSELSATSQVACLKKLGLDALPDDTAVLSDGRGSYKLCGENDAALQKLGLPKYKTAGQKLFTKRLGGEYRTEKVPELDEFGQPKFDDATGKPLYKDAPVPETLTVTDPNGGTYGLKDLFGDNPAGRTAGALLSKVAHMAEMIGVNGMIMGMAMSVPNSLMASFTAERMQQAQLATVGAPQDFGGVIMQIPDELINVTMPPSSLKVYAGVPVPTISTQIGGGGSTPSAGNIVVGPSENNTISATISSLAQDQIKAFMTTLMSASDQMESAGASANIPRYSFFAGDSKDASYFDNKNTHLFVSFSSQSWNQWGTSGITDPTFTGLMIDLNTGYVFGEDGTTVGNVPATLLGAGPNGATSVQNFLSTYAATIGASNSIFDYGQYTSGGQADVDTSVSIGSGIGRQFSSACLVNPATSGKRGITASYSGFGDNCMVGNFRNSILATSLIRIAAGVCIDQNGQEISLAPAGPSIKPGNFNTQDQKAAEAEIEAQIASFYTSDTNNIVNFAMQPKYASQQSAFAQPIYKGLTAAQLSTFAQAQANKTQQQDFLTAVYASLSPDAQAAFETKFSTFADNASLIAYVFTLATADQQNTFIQTVYQSLNQKQVVAFIQQFASPSGIFSFAQGVFNSASQTDQNTFASNSVRAAARAQSSADAASKAQSAMSSAVSSSDANQMLKEAVAQGALGGVVPIYGFDVYFQNFIQTNFPGAAAQASATGGAQPVVFTDETAASQIQGVETGVNQASTTGQAKTAALQGAPNVNYPAFGVYVYECQNTPFAKECAELTGKQVLDYIVFFDQFLNCVPVLVPSSDPKNFNLPDYELNPNIAYWGSLICYIGNGTVSSPAPLDEFMGRNTDGSTFFPLYTLNADDVAYVDGATSALDKILGGLQQNQSGATSTLNTAALSNQIQIVANIEVSTYQHGPFYPPCNLVEPAKTMWMTQTSQNPSTGASSTINVVPYVGMPPAPMTVNAGSATTVTDYLVPFVEEGGSMTTVQLPNPDIEMLVSLVTDITFKVDVDETGNARFTPTSYKSSPYNPTTGLDTSKKDTYTWLANFKGAGVTVPDALTTDVKVQRAAWVNFIETNKNDPTFMAQAHGFPYGQNYTLTLASDADYVNGIYLYTCSSPLSGVAGDYYVMSSSASLSAANKTVGGIANIQSLQPYIVSMATGFMYDNNGDIAKDSSGKPVSMDQSALLALVLKNQGGKPLSAATSSYLSNLIAQGNQYLNVKQGPYEFGNLLLNLYRVDIESSNYVYFTVNQLGIPADYFVVVQSVQSPFVFGGPINGATNNMVSLVTGQLYTRAGTAGVWPNLSTLLSAVQGTMSISKADLARINSLNKAFIEQQKAEADEKSNVDDRTKQATSLILEDIGNIAANLNNKSYLPIPYDSLVQDTDGKYYRVTPDINGNPFMIFDFNATTDPKDLGVGGMFTADGKFVTYMNGIHLAVMRQQFGVQVSSTGVQTLTIPHIAGNMNLSTADQSIVPGNSGTALISSSDSQFPTPGTPLKITSGTKTYYFYYHIFLHSYFAYTVDSKSGDKYYISFDDGTSYNLDGSARVLHYQVARDNKGNPMIVTQDTNGMLCVNFADPVSHEYMNFLSDPTAGIFTVMNIPASGFPTAYKNKAGVYGINSSYGYALPNTGLYIYQNFPAQSGTMTYNPDAVTYFAETADRTYFVEFTIDPTSQVQGLKYVPVNPKTGQIIETAVSDILDSANLILQGGAITQIIFNGILYKASAGGTYVPVSGTGDSISINSVSATQSSAAYVVISQGANEYTYSYAYDTLIPNDFTIFKQQTVGMNPAIASNTQTVLCKNISVNALQKVSVSSVKNVPDNLVNGLAVTIGTLKFDPTCGKYFVPVAAADYVYFGEAGFVDIENGAFFDAKGMAYGAALVLSDYLAILNKLNVMVVYNINTKKYDLIYRSAKAVYQEAGITPPAVKSATPPAARTSGTSTASTPPVATSGSTPPPAAT